MSIGSDALLELMRRRGIAVTRENYLDLAYGRRRPDPWTPEHEAELPEELQDWSRFKVERGKMVEK